MINHAGFLARLALLARPVEVVTVVLWPIRVRTAIGFRACQTC